MHANTGILYKVAALYTATPEDRDDLVQETIYQLWKSYGTFGGKAKASTWLYRVAMNVAIHQLKREKRRPATIPFGPGTAHPATPLDAGEDERWKLLRAHFGQLNLLEKGILFLHLEEKSYAEIAAIVGLTESNVGTRLSRIRQKLQRSVQKNTAP
ncbi:MAG: RNA polymerase sigma factor [Bacteroidota bacterium]